MANTDTKSMRKHTSGVNGFEYSARRTAGKRGVVVEITSTNFPRNNEAMHEKCAVRSDVSQATKGIRRMPWRSATTKDAVSCEKSWGAASRL